MPSLRTLAALALTLCSLVAVLPSASAEDPIGLVLEPRCSSDDRSNCPTFAVLDPTHLTTEMLHAGDIVDIDLVLTNGVGRGIKTIRSWLNYDPEILEVRNVRLGPMFTEPTPGESAADPTVRIIKIGGGVGEIPSNRAAIARITFQVKATGKNSEISFNSFHGDGLGQTAVNGDPIKSNTDNGLGNLPCFKGMICQKKIVPLLTVSPSALQILTEGDHAAATDTTVAPSSATNEPPAAENPAPQDQPSVPSEQAGNASSFSLLQVQNLRVTSKETSMFLGWQPLRSSALAGYNVYYSTVSGRYIQRRSIPATASSLVIRDLQPGTTYYAAVRGYDAQNQESVFSEEVSVTIGNPDSSSAPLMGQLIETQPPVENAIQTHGGEEINGTTGVNTTIAIFFVLCGIIGTAFAVHKQCVLLRPAHAR